MADVGFSPNVRKVLLIGTTTPIISSEAEISASGIRRLKTAYRSTMKGKRASDLNLIQMHTTSCIIVEELVQIFITKSTRRLFHHHWFSLRH